MTNKTGVNDNLLDAETRAAVAGRVEVLDKVKELFLLPELEMMTMQQMADYYEVEYDVVKKCFQRNKKEITEDGVKKHTPKTLEILKGHNVPSEKVGYITEFRLSDTVTLRVPNAGINLFSKRAVLRIGMLLRDSEIACEVRTQLLNTFEHSTVEQRTADIDEEQALYLRYAHAAIDGSREEFQNAARDIFEFKNRHIAQLKENNKILAGEKLVWSDRASINKAVRMLAGMANLHFSTVWNELYDELRYRHGIGLSQRGKPPYIQYVRENEWEKVQESFAAMCENYNVDIKTIADSSKMEGVKI